MIVLSSCWILLHSEISQRLKRSGKTIILIQKVRKQFLDFINWYIHDNNRAGGLDPATQPREEEGASRNHLCTTWDSADRFASDKTKNTQKPQNQIYQMELMESLLVTGKAEGAKVKTDSQATLLLRLFSILVLSYNFYFHINNVFMGHKHRYFVMPPMICWLVYIVNDRVFWGAPFSQQGPSW